MVKQLGTLELNRLWAHVPKGGEPSHPASSASPPSFSSAGATTRVPKSHTFLLDVTFALRSKLPVLPTHRVPCVA